MDTLSKARISAIGAYVPEKRLTNEDLEKSSIPLTNGSFSGQA